MEKQIQIVTALVEGNSVRATARMVGVEHKTVMRVLLRVGDHCARLLNERMRRLPCKVVQMDEIWTFVGKEEKRVRFDENSELVGDDYVFVAMDSESKLIHSFRVCKHIAANTWFFVQDFHNSLATLIMTSIVGNQ